MADNTVAFFWRQLVQKIGGAGVVPGDLANLNLPEPAPSILWGQGTPDGDRLPFTQVNKGSLYLAVDQTDDTSPLWVKVDEGGDNADWVKATVGGDVNPAMVSMSALYDISASDSEQVVLHAKAALTITKAYLLWNEATGASGAAEGDITIGTATGGAQIVAAAAYEVSKATGSVSDLTIVSGAVAAGSSVFASHDQAASAAGTYFLVLEWSYD